MIYLKIEKHRPAVRLNPRWPIFRADYGHAAWMVYNMAKSKNFGSVRGRRHAFRLLDRKGKIRFRGYCVFPDWVNYEALLRPLNDFGVRHGCDRIAYKVGDKYKEIPVFDGIKFSLAKLLYSFDTSEFLDMYDLRDLTEADAEQLQNYLAYISKP
ncbi:MAG: hypothetical protein IJ662_10510 [Clostridia bacterium]|nr:hypothetical protein [Clostridia bacterium]